MKKLILLAAMCWMAAAYSQEAGIHKEPAAHPEWLTDLPKALAKAQAGKKLVLMEFTGSDWCPPCKVLQKYVLSSPEFEAYAKTNLVLVLVDFPHNKPQTPELVEANKALATKYGVDGFPTVILMNANGKPLSMEAGYGGENPREFIANLEKAASKNP